jgi:D-alanyl-D-alanine carboxypeptidase (penicillin-binding protein 5/6)
MFPFARLAVMLALVALPLAGTAASKARHHAHPAPRTAAPAPSSATAIASASAIPAIDAPAWLLLDTLSGQVIAAQSADAQRDPASLTKLMTAYIVFDALRAKKIAPTQTINVSRRAWKAEGSRMFIDPKVPVSVDDLLHGMIVQSGNDAAIALAELTAGSEEAMVERMNGEARRMGLAHTHFMNVSGLTEPQHYSSASDLARLTANLIRDFPEYYPLYAIREFRYNNITQPNRNRLLGADPAVDGVKSGHTEAAGWCLIASAKHGERRLVAVVLGASSDAARAAEAQRLLNWGFAAFDTVQLYQPGKPLATLRVWKGAQPEVKAGILADRYLTLPKGKADMLGLTLETQEPLVAPIASAQRLGTVKVALEGKPVAELPLIALEEVPAGNIFRRAWDSMRLWFQGSGAKDRGAGKSP